LSFRHICHFIRRARWRHHFLNVFCYDPIPSRLSSLAIILSCSEYHSKSTRLCLILTGRFSEVLCDLFLLQTGEDTDRFDNRLSNCFSFYNLLPRVTRHLDAVNNHLSGLNVESTALLQGGSFATTSKAFPTMSLTRSGLARRSSSMRWCAGPAALCSRWQTTSYISRSVVPLPSRTRTTLLSLSPGHGCHRVRMSSSSTYRPPVDLSGRLVAVIGAGTLGRRIALMWLTRGEKVHLL
jgi:hypothetical protein